MPSLRSKKTIKSSSVKIIDYEPDEEGLRYYSTRPSSTVSKYWTEDQASSPSSAKVFGDSMSKDLEHMCLKMFRDAELHEMLRKEMFDVMIAEPFDPCGLYLGDYLQIPSTIIAMASSRIDPIQIAIGQPTGLNFIAGPNSRYGPSSSILDRINNLWMFYTRTSMFQLVYANLLDTVRQETGLMVRDITEIIEDAAYLFFNSNPYLDFPFPSLTKCVPIGGFSMNVSSWKSEQLPEDLDKILDINDKTVYISFGSVIRSVDMPESYQSSILRVITSLPNVTFLWKYEDTPTFDLPKNLHIRKWFPQPALLSDDRLSLFITHGGLGSVMEVAYAGKPTIVVPLLFDQPMNGEMLSRHGGAKVYSKYDIPDATKLANTIQDILTNPAIQQASTRLADMLISQPINPISRLVDHAEFAAKFKKLPNLDPYSRQLNFMEFYFLDIVVLIIITVTVVLYGLYWIVRDKKVKIE